MKQLDVPMKWNDYFCVEWCDYHMRGEKQRLQAEKRWLLYDLSECDAELPDPKRLVLMGEVGKAPEWSISVLFAVMRGDLVRFPREIGLNVANVLPRLILRAMCRKCGIKPPVTLVYTLLVV